MLLFLWLLLLFVCVTIVVSNSPIRLSLMDNSDTYKWTLNETAYRTGRVNGNCLVQTLCGYHVKNLENVISVHRANRYICNTYQYHFSRTVLAQWICSFHVDSPMILFPSRMLSFGMFVMYRITELWKREKMRREKEDGTDVNIWKVDVMKTIWECCFCFRY